MSKISRLMLVCFISIILGSYIYSSRVNQHLNVIKELKDEGDTIQIEQEQENCQVFINAKYCTAPRDRADRWTCSERLAESHCDKYVEVGYLILKEHKGKYDNQPEDWRMQMMKGRLGR